MAIQPLRQSPVVQQTKYQEMLKRRMRSEEESEVEKYLHG